MAVDNGIERPGDGAGCARRQVADRELKAQAWPLGPTSASPREASSHSIGDISYALLQTSLG
jgi:hypothetical protein